MKIGPVHVIRDATFRRLDQLQTLWHQFAASLAAKSGRPAPLAAQVVEHTHGLMHSPLGVRTAPPAFTDPAPPDAAELDAAERVVAAYHRALADDADPPAPSMWDKIGGAKRRFVAALERRDVRAVQHALARMFATDLTWGLGQTHPSHRDLLTADPQSHVHVRFTDTLVNLAEAVGAAHLTQMGQDPAAHLQPLNRDLDELADAVTRRLGFDPSFPAVGSAFGFRLGGRLLTIDSLTHAYNARRLTQLGAGGREAVVEVGGGYGCLAALAYRAGVRAYAIFDLPWVNVLQGYFLIRSLPAGAVRLYGETAGGVRVRPYWKLDAEPEKSCGVAVNTDSLPEMGHATARAYLPKIARVARRAFLSVNQEARGYVPGVGPQQCVADLAAEAGGFEVVSRQRYWMRQGYAEEVYRPVEDHPRGERTTSERHGGTRRR